MPMIEFKLPDLGEGITEAEIIAWQVKEGDVVEEHQPLLEAETDKAIVPVPSPAHGRIARLHHAAGDIVQVGETLVTLEPLDASAASEGAAAAAGEEELVTLGGRVGAGEGLRVMEGGEGGEADDGAAHTHAASTATLAEPPQHNGHAGHSGHAAPPPAAATDAVPATPGPSAASASASAQGAPPAEDAGSVVGSLARGEAESKPGGEVLATPAVRRLARHLNVTLEGVRGTGLGGRITEADVRRSAGPGAAAASAAPVAPAPSAPSAPSVPSAKPAAHAPAAGGTLVQTEHGPVERRPLRGVRRAIAHHLSKAMRTVVPVTNMDEADVTELVRIRAKEEKAARAHGVKLTFLPFIIKAVIQGLKQYPMLNAVLDDESEEIVLKRYYNIGIAVDTADGLMVPVVKSADKKSMLDIAGEIHRLAGAAHDRTLQLSDLRGGTFTITNLGTIGGTHATPIVNYPEVAILAIGRIRERVVPHEGQIAIRKMVGLSLTFDHRLIDGGDAARFLNCVIQHIEDPDLILIKSSS